MSGETSPNGVPPVLDVRSLTKLYSGLSAVQDVSFSIRAGETLGYLGPNGAGKSTTVKMLTGLLEPTDGQVLFHGENIKNDLIGYKQRVGYVPEEIHLYPFLTGWEYLELVSVLRGLEGRAFRKKTGELFRCFSLYEDKDSALAAYSKGMRQRVMLIAAIVHNPDILIFDEPLSGLDVTYAMVFRNLVRLFSAQGKAIFYCSHVLEVVEKVCSHLLILSKGSVVAHGSVEEVRGKALTTSLEGRFSQLVEQIDAEATAAEILAAVNAY
ncbi:MAG: ABC transporter ATP-binding protein [Bryobacteraceae bacterium]